MSRCLWIVTTDRGTWVLLRSGDRGAQWVGDSLPAPLADTYFAGDALSFVNTKDGWLLAQSGLWRTSDGGAALTRIAEPRAPP